MKASGQDAVKVAVIDEEGNIIYRNLPTGNPATEPKKGKILFPFPHAPVHSDAWRAGDHIKLAPRENPKET